MVPFSPEPRRHFLLHCRTHSKPDSVLSSGPLPGVQVCKADNVNENFSRITLSLEIILGESLETNFRGVQI